MTDSDAKAASETTYRNVLIIKATLVHNPATGHFKQSQYQ